MFNFFLSSFRVFTMAFISMKIETAETPAAAAAAKPVQKIHLFTCKAMVGLLDSDHSINQEEFTVRRNEEHLLIDATHHQHAAANIFPGRVNSDGQVLPKIPHPGGHLCYKMSVVNITETKDIEWIVGAETPLSWLLDSPLGWLEMIPFTLTNNQIDQLLLVTTATDVNSAAAAKKLQLLWEQFLAQTNPFTKPEKLKEMFPLPPMDFDRVKEEYAKVWSRATTPFNS